jgi:hypothetical protein
VSTKPGQGQNDQAWHAFQLTGVPESFLIDAAGRIVYHENGPFTNRSINRALNRITRCESIVEARDTLSFQP